MTHGHQSMKSPLARVRGLGSAKDGTHHWWMQRVTAVALIPLVIWLAASIFPLLLNDIDFARDFLKTPWRAVAFALLLSVGLYHGTLGMQVIIEDYVHAESKKIAALIAMKLAMVLALACVLYATVKIAMI